MDNPRVGKSWLSVARCRRDCCRGTRRRLSPYTELECGSHARRTRRHSLLIEQDVKKDSAVQWTQSFCGRNKNWLFPKVTFLFVLFFARLKFHQKNLSNVFARSFRVKDWTHDDNRWNGRKNDFEWISRVCTDCTGEHLLKRNRHLADTHSAQSQVTHKGGWGFISRRCHTEEEQYKQREEKTRRTDERNNK